MIWRVVAIVSTSLLVAMAAVAHDASLRAAAAEAQLDGVNQLAFLCDRALVTCVGWQARVSLELEALERVLVDSTR